MQKNVLLVGLHPDVVDYQKWPELSPEKLLNGLNAGVAALQAEGIDAAWCLTDTGETAKQVLSEALKEKQYDVVLVGAGVRTDPEHLVLFEIILNSISELAPKAKMAFNTSPFDTVEAVKRWL
ncbi:hypothetical protein [Planctobacterium marinum]|uniref:Uncharacterized protein n=1 Tax=Planctobacterium marinum TaxID=1631968 RepID=A0AA48HYN4_9ALTE|nr:hypothetical protein MACH26_25510 [Planctobacterium marinum]